MGPDLTLYIDVTRGLFVQGPGTVQPLVNPNFTQAENINVNAQFLALTTNGLVPFVNLDPTGWALSFALGYTDKNGAKQLIALASSSALTAISGVCAQTAIAFNLNLATTAAATLLGAIHSSPIWAEAAWSTQSAATGYANKAQVQGTINAAYLGVGLPAPS